MTKVFPPRDSFGDLLRQILVFEKRQSLQGVATALGMTSRDFCSRLRNGGRFDPDEVAIILREVADERLRQWFFAGGGLLLVKHAIVLQDNSNLTVRQRLIASAVDAISAICCLADMLEACILEDPQKAVIEQHFDHVMAELLSIKLQLSPRSADLDETPEHVLTKTFPELVRRVLLTDQHIQLHTFAEALNLSSRALHARLSGHVTFLPVELRQLFRMFPDPRIADYVLQGTAYTAILRPAVIELRIDGGPIRPGLLSLREMVKFLEALLLAEAAPETALPATAARHLDEAVRQLATLHWNMAYIGHRAVPAGHGMAIKTAVAA